MTHVNLLDLENEQSKVEKKPEIFRIGSDQTPIFTFTNEMEEGYDHYCSETELNGYLG